MGLKSPYETYDPTKTKIWMNKDKSHEMGYLNRSLMLGSNGVPCKGVYIVSAQSCDDAKS